MKYRDFLFVSFLLIPMIISIAACQTVELAPPPTLQAVANDENIFGDIALSGVKLLQEKSYGGDQLILYTWQDQQGSICLATSYLTRNTDLWEAHDTLKAGCHDKNQFTAAYTGNSAVETTFGPPRYTTVYGTSPTGRAVRIIWNDGQVNHIPLINGSFLEVRGGKWQVERVELLDDNYNLLQVEDWRPRSVEKTN